MKNYTILFGVVLVVSGAEAQTPAASFEIRRDGFSFSNYTNSQTPVNLTSNTIERLCGPGACARGSGENCVPAGAIRTFMNQANQSMAGGHCEGMSVLAQAIYYKHIPLTRFQGNAQKTFDLRFNNKVVQSEIAYWFATQLTYPSGYSEVKLAPSQVLTQLKKPTERYSLGIFKKDWSDGHAVTPVRVIQDGPTAWRIKIYDSNYPGNENRFIKVNTVTNTWTYADYVGNAQTKTLTLRPFSKRLEQQQCPTETNANLWTVWLDGNGKLKAPLRAKKIYRLDQKNSGRSIDPIYVISPGGGVDLKVLGENLSGNDKTNIVIFRRGQSIALEGISLSPKEVDLVRLAKDQSTLKYSTTDSENVVVKVGLTYEGADYELKISPTAQAKGFTLEAHNRPDDAKGNHHLKLKMRTHDKSPAAFRIEMTRIAGSGDDNFTHLQKEISIGAKETLTIEYGKWIKDRQSLAILRDLDSNGKIEKTEFINDEE